MSDEEDLELDIVGEGPAVQPEGCGEDGVNEEDPPSAADKAPAEEAPAETVVPQKRGRGRPRKSAGAPTPPPGDHSAHIGMHLASAWQPHMYWLHTLSQLWGSVATCLAG